MCLRNLPWNAFLIILLNQYGGTANIERCLGTKYDKRIEGCCVGEKYDKLQDGVFYSCCTGAKQLYKSNEQRCCGNQIRNNSDIKNLVCCEHHFRPKDQGVCCQGIYHENKNGGNNGCCGKLWYNSNLHHCCDGKLHVHEKMSNKKCCATNIYNSKTQWCKNQKDILPLREDSCYGEQFKTDTHICCFHQKRVYEKTTKTDDECCGSTPYSIKDYYCKNDKELISIHDSTPQQNTYICGMSVIDGDKQSCCNGAIPFDPLNQKCCGGKVLLRSEKCCDKKKLDTGSFTCCINKVKEEQVLKSKPHHNKCCFLKNGSTETYNSNDNECSLSLGAVVSKTLKCGVHTRNTTKDICCSGIVIENGRLLNLKCCGIKAYHKRNETCDKGIIINKTRFSKRTDSGPMCGMNPFNKSNDLCCSGVFIENGNTLSKSCCGIKSYFTKNQTCCDGNSLKGFDRRFRLNPCTCPSYCQRSWLNNLGNWKIWKNDKNMCRYKVFSITKTQDKTWRVNKKKRRKNKKKKKFVKFEEDCSCTCGDRNTLILLAKRITRSGKIKGHFYLLPNEKQYRHIVRRLKKQMRNKCKRGRKNITKSKKNHVKL